MTADITTPDSPRPTWERRPEESTPAYAAFVAYRDMGAERSCAKVARELGKSCTLVTRWSARHRWVERVTAWDAEQEWLWAAELGVRRREAVKRQADTATKLTDKALARLSTIDADDLSPAELARFLDLSTRIEARLYSLDPPVVSGQQVTIMFHEALRFPRTGLEAGDEDAGVVDPLAAP